MNWTEIEAIRAAARQRIHDACDVGRSSVWVDLCDDDIDSDNPKTVVQLDGKFTAAQLRMIADELDKLNCREPTG